MQQPNIIYILPDQLGADHLGCYGNSHVQTPAIDRFAGESLVFDRAYSASPVCTPYRSILFTGKYASTTGVVENGMPLPPDVHPTLAESLGEAGYRTSYLGKWHLSGAPGANRWVPPNRRGGFQEFVGWESHHVDHWDGRIFADDPSSATPQPREIPMPGHETDALTDMAIDTLHRLAGGEAPFFLVVAYQAPHPPCSPPEQFMEPYRGPLPQRPEVPVPAPDYEKPGWNACYPNDEFLRRYWGEVSHLDAAVGRLLGAIDESGLSENSIVVFTSDHGELAGSHGLYGKFVMLEGSVKVPLIVSMPRSDTVDRPRGVRTPDLFSTVDFYPTLADLGEAAVPADLPGVSFADRWRHPQRSTPSPRRYAFMEYQDRAVFDGRYKLIARGRAGRRVAGSDGETVRHGTAAPGGASASAPRDKTDAAAGEARVLFDLQTDPFEMRNLAGSPATSEVEERLLCRLVEWEATIGG